MADGDRNSPQMARRRPTAGRPRLVRPVLLIAGTASAQAALLAGFLDGSVGAVDFAAIHLAICGLVAGFGCLVRRDEAAFVFQLAAWTCLGGAFGSAMAAALLVPQRRAADEPPDGDEPAGDQAGKSRLELLHGALLDGRLRIAGAHATRPLLDVILEGGQVEKFDALSLISKHYEPALAPALRRALEDRDGSVRVLAATVIAKLNNGHTQRIGALQAATAHGADQAAGWRDLGQAHLAYAASGLLDASRAAAEAAQAARRLARAVALDPDDADLRSLLRTARRLARPRRPRPAAIRIPQPADEAMVTADAA